MLNSLRLPLNSMEVALPSRARFGAFELDLKAGEVCEGTRKILLQDNPSGSF